MNSPVGPASSLVSCMMPPRELRVGLGNEGSQLLARRQRVLNYPGRFLICRIGDSPCICRMPTKVRPDGPDCECVQLSFLGPGLFLHKPFTNVVSRSFDNVTKCA